MDTPLAMIRESSSAGDMNRLFQDEVPALLPPPPVRWTNSNVPEKVVKELEEKYEEDEQEANVIAKQLFENEYTKASLLKYVSVIGSSNLKSVLICKEYMNLFKPWPKSIVSSLRKLVSKLYLVGEQIKVDRILESFSKSWTESNSVQILEDYKIVQIISFNLLILNNNIINNNSNIIITEEEFINSIWIALQDKQLKINSETKFQSEIQSYYDLLLLQPFELLKLPNSQLKRKKTFKVLRSFSSVSNLSNRSYSKRLSSFSSTSLNTNITEFSDIDSLKDKHDEKLEKIGPPWLISGVVKTEVNIDKKKSKINWFTKLTQRNNNYKSWQDSKILVQKGLLKQFDFNSIDDLNSFNTTNSSSYVNSIGTYNLYSGIASLLEDERFSKNHTEVGWKLRIPMIIDHNNERVFIFYSKNLEIANNFIETCNFWAARITQVPSINDSSKDEYGWSDSILIMDKGFENIRVSKWEVNSKKSFIPSSYSINEQLNKLKVYLKYLNDEILKHEHLKPVIIRVWSKKRSLKDKYQLVMNNWTIKYNHLLKDRNQFQTYLDTLALAIADKTTKL